MAVKPKIGGFSSGDVFGNLAVKVRACLELSSFILRVIQNKFWRVGGRRKEAMIDQFINFVIRPPRAEYNPDQYLWETEFTYAGKSYKRQDLELTNKRGHCLRCSHYVPSSFREDTPLPCVIYCHGNSGCRADANEAVIILLPSNITVFTLDFSGSGLSDGEYVSLG